MWRIYGTVGQADVFRLKWVSENRYMRAMCDRSLCLEVNKRIDYLER